MRKILPIKYLLIVLVLFLFFASVTWALQKILVPAPAIPLLLVGVGMVIGHFGRKYFRQWIEK